MKIEYNGSIYDTDCNLTIQSMINRGGKIIEEEKKEKDYADIETRRPRGRRRKMEW